MDDISNANFCFPYKLRNCNIYFGGGNIQQLEMVGALQKSSISELISLNIFSLGYELDVQATTLQTSYKEFSPEAGLVLSPCRQAAGTTSRVTVLGLHGYLHALGCRPNALTS